MNIKEVKQATRRFQVVTHQEGNLVSFAVIDGTTGDRWCLFPTRERAQEYADHMNACMFLHKIKEPTRAMIRSANAGDATGKLYGAVYIWKDMIEALLQEMISEY